MLLVNFCFTNVRNNFFFVIFELYVRVVNFLGKLANGTCL